LLGLAVIFEPRKEFDAVLDKRGIAANPDPYQRIIASRTRSKQKSLSDEAKEEIGRAVARFNNSLIQRV
jgi:hypothetical protein